MSAISSSALRCPACDEPVEGNLGRVPASITGEAVRLSVDCSTCAEALELVARGSTTWRVVGQGR